MITNTNESTVQQTPLVDKVIDFFMFIPETWLPPLFQFFPGGTNQVFLVITGSLGHGWPCVVPKGPLFWESIFASNAVQGYVLKLVSTRKKLFQHDLRCFRNNKCLGSTPSWPQSESVYVVQAIRALHCGTWASPQSRSLQKKGHTVQEHDILCKQP